MQECQLLFLLALAFACCAMAAREDLKKLLVTAEKCCEATGMLSYHAPDQLLAEPLSQGTFSGYICKQGSKESTSMYTDCQTNKAYTFPGLAINAPQVETVDVTIKFTTVETLDSSSCDFSSRCKEEGHWGSVVSAIWENRAKNLQCSEDTILRPEQQSKDCKKRQTVAVLADYDRCWDIISATNPHANATKFNSQGFEKSYENVTGNLRDQIETITSDSRVILFVGSDRQSYQDDIVKAGMKINGRALGTGNAFESWVHEFGHDWGTCWELNKALLSDSNQPCSSWNEERQSPKNTEETEEQTKVNLLQNVIKQLLLEDFVKLYVFDDNKDILEYVRLNAKIPKNMELTTIHYDWFADAGGMSIVNQDY